MKKADLYFNIFLVAVSVFAFVEGLGYPYDFKRNVGSGFFPRWLAAILFVLALVNLYRIVRSLKGTDKPFFATRAHRARLAVMFVSLFFYIAAITYLGMFIATFLYTLFVYRLFDKFSWKATLPPAIGIVVFIYVIFSLVLRLRLPVPFWN